MPHCRFGPLVSFVDGALFASWASRIPALSARVGADAGALGLTLLAPAVGALIAMPIVGRPLPGRSSRTFCRLAIATLLAAVLLPGLARSVPGAGADTPDRRAGQLIAGPGDERPGRLPPRLIGLGAACLFSLLAEGAAPDWSAKLVHDDLPARPRWARSPTRCSVSRDGPADRRSPVGALGLGWAAAPQRHRGRPELCAGTGAGRRVGCDRRLRLARPGPLRRRANTVPLGGRRAEHGHRSRAGRVSSLGYLGVLAGRQSSAGSPRSPRCGSPAGCLPSLASLSSGSPGVPSPN